MVDKAQTSSTSIEEATLPVTPECSNTGGQEEAKEEDKVDIPPVLPLHDFALAQVADISNTGTVAGLDKHPPNVREKEALVRIVRIEVCVGIAVMCTVTTGPPFDGTLNSTGSCSRKEVLKGF